MTNLKISNRLKTIGDLIDDGSSICDVGCDHALLSIYICLNKNNVSVIASDIKEKPLETAKNNIKKYGLDDKIKLVLSNGLNNIDDFYDTVIISGLGGNTIIDILKKDKLNSVNTIIISPQNNTYRVRKHINNLGYYFENEVLIKENDIIYTIIKLKRGYKKYKKYELMLGPILLTKKTELFYLKINNEYNKYNEILKQIPKNKICKRFIIKQYLNLMNKNRRNYE